MTGVQSKYLETAAYSMGKMEKKLTEVIGEKAVTLTINNEIWLTFMCTPNELEAMAIGFLYNEEIINVLEDVASLRVCDSRDNIDVWLNRAVEKPTRWTRTSGCSGGKTSVHKKPLPGDNKRPTNGIQIPAQKVGYMIDQLRQAQDIYQKTGGVHTSALSDGEQIILMAEDIGRHNTLDKLAGRYLIEHIQLANKIILTTGRISSEMIQKAGRMGAAMVISHTSPSTLSVEMAEGLGITLIGYARHDRFTVYSYPERILTIPIGEEIHTRSHDK